MIMKMPPEFRGHRFFNFRRIFGKIFYFILIWVLLFVSLTDLLVSFAREFYAFTREFCTFTREFYAFTREFCSFTREFCGFTREFCGFTRSMHGKSRIGISDRAATNHNNFEGFHDFIDGCPGI
ncbi:hypothetical protein SRABI133_04609 [Peribacillus simplex]|uniref:Uncharacterized protein n=1 Tax=Peribacillus simplex TaxID=1478 RepID=A0A9W4PJG6_9BACI|nr:hypothetical protein SRABI133_04609 [Peribacillus simplex]